MALCWKSLSPPLPSGVHVGGQEVTATGIGQSHKNFCLNTSHYTAEDTFACLYSFAFSLSFIFLLPLVCLFACKKMYFIAKTLWSFSGQRKEAKFVGGCLCVKIFFSPFKITFLAVAIFQLGLQSL